MIMLIKIMKKIDKCVDIQVEMTAYCHNYDKYQKRRNKISNQFLVSKCSSCVNIIRQPKAIITTKTVCFALTDREILMSGGPLTA